MATKTENRETLQSLRRILDKPLATFTRWPGTGDNATSAALSELRTELDKIGKSEPQPAPEREETGGRDRVRRGGHSRER